jgi:hypothetical protein
VQLVALTLSKAPALIPAVGLIAGTTAGVYLPAPEATVLRVVIVTAWTAAILAFGRQRGDVATLCLLAGFGAGGWVIASAAADGARHTPLGAVFESEKARAPLERAIAVNVEGTLQEDATERPWGASLTILVDRIRVGPDWHPTSGGLRASVTGPLSAVTSTSGGQGAGCDFRSNFVALHGTSIPAHRMTKRSSPGAGSRSLAP